MPFIVRREDGFQDRDRYTILQLWQPGKAWRAWAPQEQWNHKLVVTHGGNCGASYAPGEPPLQDYSGTLEAVPGVTPSYVTALGKGFAVLSTALANTGHNCNVAMEAESLLMAKERLVERYGELRYTIGTGCSGGSIAQHTVANAYPGIYQGLVTTCSYPDTLTAGAQFADYHLMRLYFEDPTRWAPGVVWTPMQMAAVEGHLSHVNAVVADEGLFKAALDPENACSGTVDPVAGDESTRYDSETNPGGVRCSVLDIMGNLLGPRPASVWSEQEQAAGHGFAGVPFANTGVQFGLAQVRSGLITPAQFVDLNTRLGGLDVDSQPTEQRIEGDPASIARGYRTGLINEMTNLDEVAIINHGGPDPGIAHDYAHAFWTEERLLADQGHTDNRVMWFGPTPLIGSPDWANEALVAMDSWLTRGRGRRPVRAAGRQGRRGPPGRRHRPLRPRRARGGLRRRGAPGAPDPALDPAAGGGRPAGQRQRGLRAPPLQPRRLRDGRRAVHPRAGRPPSRSSSPPASATGHGPAGAPGRPRPGCATTPPTAPRRTAGDRCATLPLGRATAGSARPSVRSGTSESEVSTTARWRSLLDHLPSRARDVGGQAGGCSPEEMFTSQVMPNLSVHMPKVSPHIWVLSSSRTVPPSASAWYQPDSSVSSSPDRLTLTAPPGAGASCPGGPSEAIRWKPDGVPR